MPIDRLKPAPYNPREIGTEALAALGESVRQFGLVQPLVWNRRTGHVVGGNQRLLVLKAEGAVETAVVVVDLPLGREKALCLSLNNPHSQGHWTADLEDLIREVTAAAPVDSLALRLDALVDELPAGEDGQGESDAGGGLADQFAILITCASETQQTKLLGRFQREGLPCKAYVL